MAFAAAAATSPAPPETNSKITRKKRMASSGSSPNQSRPLTSATYASSAFQPHKRSNSTQMPPSKAASSSAPSATSSPRSNSVFSSISPAASTSKSPKKNRPPSTQLTNSNPNNTCAASCAVRPPSPPQPSCSRTWSPTTPQNGAKTPKSANWMALSATCATRASGRSAPCTSISFRRIAAPTHDRTCAASVGRRSRRRPG
uniref:(northern house mosquito) hypothetical protein n=1 Tax=Culex pipiens TaxID=7175 RepID=A0A8D8BEQ9_CULPI